tara:strand:- start:553 stop:804 length:252 start_codon:yes stop_codon:yes gene_type:complete
MAITKVKALNEVLVNYENGLSDPSVIARYKISVDDPSDDDLPVTTYERKHLERYINNEDGTQTATDVTGEDQSVQDICGAVWS